MHQEKKERRRESVLEIDVIFLQISFVFRLRDLETL